VENLLTEQRGINMDESINNMQLPFTLVPETGCCRECTAKAVNHILYIERLKNLHKDAKREAKRHHEESTQVIGTETLEYWPRLALSAYMRESGLDTEDDEMENGNELGKIKSEEDEKSEMDDTKGGRPNQKHLNGENVDKDTVTSSCDIVKSVPVIESKDNGCDSQLVSTSAGKVCDTPISETVKDSSSEVTDAITDAERQSKELKETTKELQLFNEDIVCPHNLESPSNVSCRIPKSLASEIMELCKDLIHPAIYQEDFGPCADCMAQLENCKQACSSGLHQKKQLMNLFRDIKRPHPMRDRGKNFFVVSKEFILEWKSYIRSCERGEYQVLQPQTLDNSSLLCTHGTVLFPVFALQPHELT
ncbi:hypothetical protein SK128_020331, partial [Halocaridina rubra]